MENANQPAGGVMGVRKESSVDPVKAEGILATVTKKEKDAARLWSQRWGFYKNLREIQEEEALKTGFTLDEYRAILRSRSCKPEDLIDPVQVKHSPKPLPQTTSGMIGHRVNCTLERFGRLVTTAKTYPIRPPLPPGQIYDPYKQTMVFLGSLEGDPISYKLPPATCEVTDEMWARSQQMHVSPYQNGIVSSLRARP
ncbi:unnamed protein product [Pieris brassicae]|uniref:Uncharacterized protein n=1 Tax=Pieris brassicae TaxID=7116 RepID=A0A9P0SSU8_PIEBR|nr:unnamed protein product [Pieris brassicae]